MSLRKLTIASVLSICLPVFGQSVNGVQNQTVTAAPPFSGDLSNGILADYLFEQTTGTSVIDSSGNNNTGTFVNTPVWTGNGRGLTTGLTSGVQLPTAMSPQIKTLVMAVNYPGSTTYGTLMTSTTSTGYNVGMALPVSSFPYPQANGTLTVYDFGNQASAAIGFNGFHILTVVFGTGNASTNHFYVDGVETPYSSQGTTGWFGSQTGYVCIGTCNLSTWANAGAIATFYRVRAYSTTLTSADIYQLSQAFISDAQAWGIQTKPIPLQNNVANLVCIGDSITNGNGTTPYCSVALSTLTSQPSYNYINQGVGNQGNGYFLAALPQISVNQCTNVNGQRSVANIAFGANDFGPLTTTPTVSANAVWQREAANIQALKAAGCIVFVSTMLSHTGTDTGGNTLDADKDAFNAVIRQHANDSDVDGITDNAANALMGADGANTNLTYFGGDGIHPTQTGQNLMAVTFANALNYFFGTTQSNPTIVTTATYTMLASDRYVVATPTANTTITLPTCLGQTGAVYTINNTTAFTVTVQNSISSQPINGTDYSTAGLVLTGATNTFTDRANSSVAAGCQWAK